MTEPLSPEAYDRVREGVLATTRRRRRRRRALAGGLSGAVAILVLSGAAWAVTAPLQVRERSVACYPEADVGAVAADGQRSLDDAVDDAASYAVEFCASLWEVGVIGAGGAVPTLDLCVRNDGTYAVYPRDEGDTRTNSRFCAALSLGGDPRD